VLRGRTGPRHGEYEEFAAAVAFGARMRCSTVGRRQLLEIASRQGASAQELPQRRQM